MTYYVSSGTLTTHTYSLHNRLAHSKSVAVTPANFMKTPFYSAPVGVRSIDQPVCHVRLCVCVCLSVREHISGTVGLIRMKFCVRISCGHGSVLLRRRCAMLCTSGFMDDVTFGRNGRDGGKGRQPSATGAESDVYECLFSCYCRVFASETYRGGGACHRQRRRHAMSNLISYVRRLNTVDILTSFVTRSSYRRFS